MLTSLAHGKRRGVSQKRPKLAQSGNLYDDLLVVIDAHLEDDMDDFSRDEFHEAREIILSMRNARAQWGRFRSRPLPCLYLDIG